MFVLPSHHLSFLVSFSQSESGGVRERILSTLLNEMDGVDAVEDVTVIGATNRIDLVDAA